MQIADNKSQERKATDFRSLCSVYNSAGAERGGALTVLVVVIVGISLLIYLVFGVFGHVVNPDEIGIRENCCDIPGLLKKGAEPEGLLPGLHWKVPILSQVHTIPRDFQFLHFNDDADSQTGEWKQDHLEIPTTDGSKVTTDITLVVRYFEEPGDQGPRQDVSEDKSDSRQVPLVRPAYGPHGGPKDLINRFTMDDRRQLELLVKESEDYLKGALSSLSTTDYYNPVLRENAALSANEKINEQVNPLGIQVWGTLIRRYVYSEQSIDDQIFAKNLQEQTELLNAAKRQLEEAKAETKDKLTEWDARIKDVQVKAEQDKKVIVSEADRYEIEQKSRGDRLVQEAIAEVDKAKNKILTETPGADIYVARQMAPLLTTLEGGVVTDIDPFDINAWVKKLVRSIE